MTEWSFLTNHARVLVCIAHDPGVRLRDIATTLDITERSAYSIVTDLTASGYVVKAKDGRRNRYQIQAHLPLREAITQQRTIGEARRPDIPIESDTRRATTTAHQDDVDVLAKRSTLDVSAALTTTPAVAAPQTAARTGIPDTAGRARTHRGV